MTERILLLSVNPVKMYFFFFFVIFVCIKDCKGAKVSKPEEGAPIPTAEIGTLRGHEGSVMAVRYNCMAQPGERLEGTRSEFWLFTSTPANF